MLPLRHGVSITHHRGTAPLSKPGVRRLHRVTKDKAYPLPLPGAKLPEKTELKSLEGRGTVISSSESEVKGLKFIEDEGNVFITPLAFPKTHPFYVPPGSLEKGLSIKTVFNLIKELKDLEKPKGDPQLPLVGKKVKVNIGGKEVKGKVLGFEYQERAVVGTSKGERIITDPKVAKACIPEKGEYTLCAETLKMGKVFKTNNHFSSLMEHALLQKIVGDTSAQVYIEWMHNNGIETFILGGAVRDIAKATVHNPHLSQADAVRIVNDIDVSCVAGVPTARRMFAEIHKSDPEVHIAGFPEYGGVHAKKGGGNGFDFNAMMIGNRTYDARRVHPDTPNEEAVVPAIFGGLPEACSEALDFCCNALMYDPVNRVIIDPTGHGVEDAAHGFLRLTGGEKLLKSPAETLAFKQPEMLQRFWKFRMRGMNSNAYTTLLFHQTAQRRWSKVEPIRFYNDIMRILPVAKVTGSEVQQKEQILGMLDTLEKKLQEDEQVTGISLNLYDAFIKPQREQIADYIINYKKKR